MASTLIRQFLARHTLGWICAGAAILGVLFGAALSLYLAQSPGASGLGDVRRLTLAQNTAPALPSAIPQDISAEPDDPLSAERADPSPMIAETEPAPGDRGEPRTMARASADGSSPAAEQRMLRTDFDLAKTRDETPAIEVSKPIHLDGRAIGVASLSIDRHSRLRVSARDLGRLLPTDLFSRIRSEASHIGFDELRDAGLDISYDPLADAIEIKS